MSVVTPGEDGNAASASGEGGAKWDILTEKDPLEPTNWEDFEERLDAIGIPDDPHERADFVAGMLRSGDDVEKFGLLLHEVLVPGVDSVENSGRGGDSGR